MTTDPTPSTTTARETTVTENKLNIVQRVAVIQSRVAELSRAVERARIDAHSRGVPMSADQAPAADPTPGSSRVDVAGLLDEVLAAVCSVRAPMTGDGLFYADDDGTLPIYNEDDTEAALIADAVASVVAARLATAEAEVERLRAIALPTADLVQELRLARENLHHSRAMSGAHFDLKQRAEHRAEVAERQVQAVRDLHRRLWLPYREWCETCGDEWPCVTTATIARAALAPLDPDAPTGHDGHGDPDTHQGDTDTDATPAADTDEAGERA